MKIKKSILHISIIFLFCGLHSLWSDDIVVDTKRIYLEQYPDAFNPSMIQTDYGYLMTFRYCPNRKMDSYSFIGVVKLNESFDPISIPQILDSRFGDTTIPSHSEDARILTVGGRIYLTYNDNPDMIQPTNKNRRDIFVAELIDNGADFTLISPIRLIHSGKYNDQLWQKNWVPFDWHGILLMGYSIRPHEVLFADLESGDCLPIGHSKTNYDWKYGTLRGGTPALLVGNEYLAFFHSSKEGKTEASEGKKMLHYFMGAYTFSAAPPFAITKISPKPIVGDDFYTPSIFNKRVIFPGGFVASGDFIYVIYGKNEYEIWVATLNKNKLVSSMKTLKKSKEVDWE